MRLAALTNMHQQTERPLNGERIVAVGLLTQRDLSLLGPTFTRVWQVEDAPMFSELLRAIDDADQDLNKRRNKSGSEPRR
jgi:hypothetical protein